MLCEENSLNAIKPRGFSDALIANQRRYDLESTSNIVNSSGWRVRGFVAIEVLVQPDLSPNGWRAAINPESDAGRRGLRLADNDKIGHKGGIGQHHGVVGVLFILRTTSPLTP